MPLYWSYIDTYKAIICSAVPTFSALVGSAFVVKDESLISHLKSQHFSSCALTCKYAYLLGNTGTAIPFGYASYLIYKIGGGFDYTDTTVALGLYGATVASGLALVPVLKKKNSTALCINSLLVAAFSVATTGAFFTIDKVSAYWTLPFTTWAIYCASLTLKGCECFGKKGQVKLE